MSALGAILWLWLLVSISVYGYRIYRRFNRASETAVDGQAETGAADPNKPVGAATALIQNPIAGFEQPPSPELSASASAPSSSVPSSGGTDPDPTTPIPLAAPAAPTTAITPPAPPEPAAAPSWTSPPVGADAPSAVPASERRAPRRPVSEAVAGIQLPCDLVPLLGDATRIDPFDIAFSTTTHDEPTVRGAMGGELLRLGYQVTPTSSQRLTASRADAEVVITIFDDPAKAVEGGQPLYPSAIPGSVVVRLQS